MAPYPIAVRVLGSLSLFAAVGSAIVGDAGFVPVAWNYTGLLPMEYKGEHRLYHVMFPQGWEGSQALSPAIMLLHGAGNNASVFEALQTLSPAALRLGYAVIFPEGAPTTNYSWPCKERNWNAGTCCGEATIADVDDIAFLKSVIGHATKTFPQLDRDRIFVSGASNGGSMTVRAACEMGSKYFAGAAANVGSFEPVRGEHCGTNCRQQSPGDGYWYCNWDQTRLGCREEDYLAMLPSVFDCTVHGKPLPILLFNGNFDPFSSPGMAGDTNNTGLVSFPIDNNNNTDPTAYNITFPPLKYASNHLARMNGCDMSASPATSFRNGTNGNMTVCRTYAGCKANVTTCLSDAPHVWFGDFFPAAYSHEVCVFETGSVEQCTPTPPAPGAPPPMYNTDSINETAETLAFFASISTKAGRSISASAGFDEQTLGPRA